MCILHDMLSESILYGTIGGFITNIISSLLKTSYGIFICMLIFLFYHHHVIENRYQKVLSFFYYTYKIEISYRYAENGGVYESTLSRHIHNAYTHNLVEYIMEYINNECKENIPREQLLFIKQRDTSHMKNNSTPYERAMQRNQFYIQPSQVCIHNKRFQNLYISIQTNSNSTSIQIQIRHKKNKVIQDFLHYIKKSYIKKYFKNTTIKYIYFLQRTEKENIQYSVFENYSKICFEDLFFQQKKDILQRYHRFMSDAKQYKLNFLLYGPSGTGKTSFISAFANYTRRHIQYVKLSSVHSFQELLDVFYSKELQRKDGNHHGSFVGHNEKIIVLEDIDAEFSNILKQRFERKKQETNEKKTQYSVSSLNLSDILQIFDGLIKPDKLICILTTNHIEALDEAFLRDGRMDMKINFTSLTKELAYQMISKFFSHKKPITYFHLEKKQIVPATLERLCLESSSVEELNQKLKLL